MSDHLVEAYRLPTLLAAVAMLALATFVLVKRPGGRLQQAFFLFMTVRATQWILLFVNDSMLSLTGRLAEYWTIVLPFAAAYFAYHFLREFGGMRNRLWRGTPWALLAGSAVLITVQIVWRDHWLVTLPNVATIMLTLGYLSFALVGAMMIWSSTRSRGALAERSMLLLGTAFLLEPAYRGTQFAFAAFAAEDLGTYSTASARFMAGMYLLSLVVCAEAAVHASAKRKINWPWAAVLTASLTGMAVQGLWTLYYDDVVSFTIVVWSMFTAAAIFNLAIFAGGAYALLHGQLFNIDLGVKATIRQSTVAIIVTLIFLIISEGLETFTPFETLAASVLAAVAIAVALKPIQWGAKKLADQILPGVEKTPEYDEFRRLQLYQAVLEETYEDGELTLKERRVLDGLQKNLGVPQDRAAEMEAAMQARFHEPEGL